ncbi:MAG: NADH:flavin oxidoreductase [Halarsenatibacteraceae bacterium]
MPETYKLLTPIQINNLILKNRIVLPPLASEKATENGKVTDKLLDYYRERTGNGLMMVEHCYIDEAGKASANQLAVNDGDKLEGLKQLASLIKAAGSAAGIQLAHAGAKADPEVTGQKSYSSSGVKPPGLEIDYRIEKLSRKKIKELLELYSRGARIAKAAGFDLIEIHAAHGYLLNQFISPLTNKRGDEYGGNLSNRFRIIGEVIEAVREVTGDNFPLAIRLGSDDLEKDGLNPAEAAQGIMPYLDSIDLLDLSGGLKGYGVLDKGQEGFTAYLADEFKKQLNDSKRPPILIAGGIKTASFAEKLLVSGRTELVGVGRAQLKDKSWPAKALNELNNN